MPNENPPRETGIRNNICPHRDRAGDDNLGHPPMREENMATSISLRDLEKIVQSQTGVLEQMSASLSDASMRMTTSVDELRKEVQDLRDTRFRPYLTSMGLFVAITLGVTGYVYGLERRSTQTFFRISSEISEIGTSAEVTAQQVAINAERALARQNHALNREAAHQKLHESLDQRMRDYYEGLLAVSSSCGRRGVQEVIEPN